MINYELAKKLRDAGFRFEFGNEVVLDTFPSNTSFERHPTLSELIEACEGGEFELKRGVLTDNKNDWSAGINYKTNRTFGSTPEEAVANLWLALNSKVV